MMRLMAVHPESRWYSSSSHNDNAVGMPFPGMPTNALECHQVPTSNYCANGNVCQSVAKGGKVRALLSKRAHVRQNAIKGTHYQ